MKKNKILPIVATVILAGAMFLAGCEKENIVKSYEETWVCDTNNYRIELYFSNDGNTFFSKVKNFSYWELMFNDSTWNDIVWQNDSVIQIVPQITANDTISVSNNLFKISHISADVISMQFVGYSNFPTWLVHSYQFKITK